MVALGPVLYKDIIDIKTNVIEILHKDKDEDKVLKMLGLSKYYISTKFTKLYLKDGIKYNLYNVDKIYSLQQLYNYCLLGASENNITPAPKIVQYIWHKAFSEHPHLDINLHEDEIHIHNYLRQGGIGEMIMKSDEMLKVTFSLVNALKGVVLDSHKINREYPCYAKFTHYTRQSILNFLTEYKNSRYASIMTHHPDSDMGMIRRDHLSLKTWVTLNAEEKLEAAYERWMSDFINEVVLEDLLNGTFDLGADDEKEFDLARKQLLRIVTDYNTPSWFTSFVKINYTKVLDHYIDSMSSYMYYASVNSPVLQLTK